MTARNVKGFGSGDLDLLLDLYPDRLLVESTAAGHKEGEQY